MPPPKATAAALAPPAWHAAIARALERGSSTPTSRYLQIATVRPDGRPAVRSVVFRGWFDYDVGIDNGEESRPGSAGVAATPRLGFVTDARYFLSLVVILVVRSRDERERGKEREREKQEKRDRVSDLVAVIVDDASRKNSLGGSFSSAPASVDAARRERASIALQARLFRSLRRELYSVLVSKKKIRESCGFRRQASTPEVGLFSFL